MIMSKAVSPHTFSVVEVDYANVDVVRSRVKNEWKKTEGFSLTYLPFISRAVVDALVEFPHLNASLDGNELVVHQYLDLGIAVDLDYQGLLVPVVRDAESKRLRALAREISDLGARAKARKLSPDEIQGGTYTVSNVGTFGNVMGTPIINQPQVAILALGAVRKIPAVIETPEGDMIGIRHKMFLSHSYDHRVVDGALGGMFVKRVADYLEQFDPNRVI